VYVHPYPDELARAMRADVAVTVEKLPETVFSMVSPLLEGLFQPVSQ